MRVLSILVFIFFIACSSKEQKGKKTTKLEDSTAVFEFTYHVVDFLKDKNFAGLSRLVHPEKGLTFSPFGYIDPQTAVTVDAERLRDIFGTRLVITWGHEDGTGDPIELTFAEYYEEYLFEKDYNKAEVKSFNKRIGTGNTVDNIKEVFPNAVFVEYHFPGFDARFQGMDWLSLRVVVEKHNGLFYVVALVNDRWTI